MYKRQVQLNATKSVAVEFSKRRKHPVRQLRIGRTYLRWSKEVKYLGLHLDRRLTWRTHAQAVLKQASARLSLLFPLLISSAITRKLGKIIVGAYLLPVITYACSFGGYLAVMHKKKLLSVLDRGIRLAAKAPRRFSSRLLSCLLYTSRCV